MKNRIITIDNAVDWARLKRKLEEQQLKFTSWDNLEDSAIAIHKNNQANAKHMIIIDEGDRASNLFDDASRISTNSNPKRSRFFKIILPIYAVIVTLVLARYIVISQHALNRNYSFSWSLNNKYLKATHKSKSGTLIFYHDSNFDNNTEKTEYYANGLKSIVAIDEDENGLPEKQIYYGTKGYVVGSALDKDQNGTYEKTFYITSKKDSLILSDQNQDGLCEFIQLGNKVLRK